MSESDQSDDYEQFANLAPPQPTKLIPEPKKINAMLKKKMDKDLERKVKQSKPSQVSRVQRDQRSRSRERYESRYNRLFIDVKYGDSLCKTEQLLKEGNSSELKKIFDHQVIEISDDEEQGNNQQYNKFEALLRSIDDPIYLQQIDHLNWRERRRLYRMLQRQQRYYRFGKLRDQLSFKVFNTIEEYFR